MSSQARAVLDETKKKYDDAKATTMSVARETGERVSDLASKATDAAAERAARLADLTKDGAEAATRAATQVGKKLGGAKAYLSETDREQITQDLVTSAKRHRGLLGALAGFVVGIVVARSRRN